MQPVRHLSCCRFPGLSLATPKGELSWRPSFNLRGLACLPVRLR